MRMLALGQKRMSRHILPLALAIAVMATAANAADLPVRSRIGTIFAEPVEARAPQARHVETEYETVFAPEVDISSIVHGYYGKPKSFRYRSYYGTSPDIIFGRLPYACGSYGYC